MDLVGINAVRWDKGGTELAYINYINHHMRTGFSYVSESCQQFIEAFSDNVLNVHAPGEDKIDSFYEDLECVFDHFKILLGDFNSETEREVTVCGSVTLFICT